MGALAGVLPKLAVAEKSAILPLASLHEFLVPVR